MPTILIPDPSLILLIGPSGAGKSTFARKHFLPTEVVSSDGCRALIIDNEADQTVSGNAFALLRQITRYRLECRRLTVIDATNLEQRSRRSFLRMAKAAKITAIAILFDVGLSALRENNQKRPGRVVPDSVIESQIAALELTRPELGQEGYAFLYQLDAATILTTEVDRRPNFALETLSPS